MQSATECKCCQEIPEVKAKLDSYGDENVTCISQHPGFATGCLDVYVLEIAYYEYRQRYGRLADQDLHM